MRIGISADHAGLEMKERIATVLRDSGHDVVDQGAYAHDPEDDYPDFVLPMTEHVARGDVDRGICVCGSGIGAAIAANKVNGGRAAVVMDTVSAKTGVEDNDVNVLCLGSRFIEFESALAIVEAFLQAEFAHKPRKQRQIERLAAIERGEA